MKGETNVGYEIIESISLEDETYVLGEKLVDGQYRFVTWMKKGDLYYHGHYTMDYLSAKIDLRERAKRSLEWEIEQLMKQGGYTK